MSFVALHALAYSFEAACPTGITLKYTITSATAPMTVSVTGVNTNISSLDSVAIPEQVTDGSGITYTVTAIGASAFMESSITGVSIPNSVTSIGSSPSIDVAA
jgi:hypothetical protein